MLEVRKRSSGWVIERPEDDNWRKVSCYRRAKGLWQLTLTHELGMGPSPSGEDIPYLDEWREEQETSETALRRGLEFVGASREERVATLIELGRIDCAATAHEAAEVMAALKAKRRAA